MVEQEEIWLTDAGKTRTCGKSLVHSLYTKNITIGLQGDLGSGKTTFTQAFLKELGIQENVTSPTYALEQRYTGKDGIEVIHMDLYRLHESDAEKFMEQTADHKGIRCIEWIERTGNTTECDILLSLSDHPKEGRNLCIEFRDMDYPSEANIAQWREDVQLPEHIQKHCDAVAAFSNTLCDTLKKKGIIVRREALHRAAQIHDLFRFVDFKELLSKSPEEYSTQERVWHTWKMQYPDCTHEEACTAFLEEQGFVDFASIILPHGLGSSPAYPLRTIEQKILFYADKRVMEDQVVTLKQRFDDFVVRYGNGKQSPQSETWFQESVALEKELLGE